MSNMMRMPPPPPNMMGMPPSNNRIMLAVGNSDIINNNNSLYLTNIERQRRCKGKRIKFDKAFKPHKHKSDIFMWGKPRPPRLFPKYIATPIPFKHDLLSKRRFIYITASKNGTHYMGITDNDWSFVWGESNFCGALGLGQKVKSTLPYLLKSLRKKNIIQISCSSTHGIAISNTSKVFGWGSKELTNLEIDTQEPHLLPFLDNLDIVAVDCCSTHTAVYTENNTNVYQFGIKGPWLGLKNINKTFGKVIFNDIISSNEKLAISKICVANQYTMYLFNDGKVFTNGVNKHGRMGCGKQIIESQKPIQIVLPETIGEISCAQYHSGFISFKKKVYSCGIGKDYRLGHQNENTYYEPKLIEYLSHLKFARIQCIENRTFVITKYGIVLMFGFEPITNIIYKIPLMFNSLRTHRIYQICATKDCNVALGVEAKELIQEPNIRMKTLNKDVFEKCDIYLVVSNECRRICGIEIYNKIDDEIFYLIASYRPYYTEVDIEPDNSQTVRGLMGMPPFGPNMMGMPPPPPNMMGMLPSPWPPNMMGMPPNMMGMPPNTMGMPPNTMGMLPNTMAPPPFVQSNMNGMPPPDMMGMQLPNTAAIVETSHTERDNQLLNKIYEYINNRLT